MIKFWNFLTILSVLRYKNKELDYILEKEEEITTFLKELNDCKVISDEVYKRLKPSGSQPGVLYGLCKVHTGVSADGSPPPFRTILSAINTPSYKIAKFLTPLLSALTKNEFVSKDSFHFQNLSGIRIHSFIALLIATSPPPLRKQWMLLRHPWSKQTNGWKT